MTQTPKKPPQEAPVTTRDTRFQPGVSGNPAGRPKGIKNRITLERLLLEEDLRNQLKPRAKELLDTAIEMALGGNDRIMRALLDKVMATPKNDDSGDAKDSSVTVIIKNQTAPEKAPVLTINKGQAALPPKQYEDGELLDAEPIPSRD